MTFIYCRHCDWGQDDFYDWRLWKRYSYNPVTKILGYIKEYARPRFIKFDPGFRGGGRFHSWDVMLFSIVRALREWYHMKWPTYRKWRKAYKSGKATCPTCGRTDGFTED
jgi:hypothetical protein